jgi:hypothetical protein
MNGHDDVDVVDFGLTAIEGMEQPLLHEGARESFFTGLDLATANPALRHGT